ncbi:MAG: sporulation protein YunB [Bacilli bacterium]|nr:sporulation protein YunB [Bacilli bacterium]
MKKIHLKKRKFKSKSNVIVIIILIIMISIYISFSFINKKIIPVFMDYAESEANKIAVLVINQAINEEITNNLNIEDLFLIIKDNNGNIKSIDFNPIYVNKMLSKINNNVQNYLSKLEQGKINLENNKYYNKNDKLKSGVIFEIPSGVIFNNVILSNIGPKIPVKLNMIGNISSNIYTDVTEYGINNAVVKIFVNIQMMEQVILPYVSKKITVKSDIPIAIKLIQGEIPNYYFNGIKSSNLSIPTN